MKAAPFDLVRPASVKEAVAALAADRAKPLSGGQSLGPMLNLRLARPNLLIDLGRMSELRGIEDRGAAGVLFGAGITHAEFEDRHLPDPTGGILSSVARGIAYRAVRNRGTIGGSLAHADPAADWPTTLAAIGASVRLLGPNGERYMAVEDFIVGAFETDLAPREIVAGVLIPRISKTARWGYWKACRKVGEFAEAMAAALSDPERSIHRLVVGATEARAIVVTDAAAIFVEPKLLNGRLASAGLDADPSAFALHQAAVRHAIDAMNQWTSNA